MKAGIANSLSARCAGACPFGRTFVCAKKAREVGGGLAGAFLEKGGKKNAKQEHFRKKVHKFLFDLSLFSKTKYFSCERFDYSKLKTYFCA